MKFLSLPLFGIGLFATKAYAWGSEGHITVGNIAQSFLKPNIAQQVKGLLGDPKFNGELGPASIWADEIKKKSGSPFAFWSAPLHFMDTHDNPGNKCSVDEGLDCPDGVCVVGAIANYTTQLDCKSGTSSDTRDIALRFLTHFFGDITQPLHVCGRELGGNQHKVTFNGKQSNLHSIWDTGLVQKRLKDFGGSVAKYSDFLVTQINGGTLTKESADWISCVGPSRTRRGLEAFMQKRAESKTRCPLIWATDTNGINCPIVWEYVDANPNVDLAGEYYTKVVPYIDRQIAKGGYRLGIFLNTLLSECPSK